MKTAQRKQKPPLRNGTNGRDLRSGKFSAGNQFAKGRGNPFARRCADLRRIMLEELTDADMRSIIRKLIAKAKKGDLRSAREVLNRSAGKPISLDPKEPLQLDDEERQLIRADARAKSDERRELRKLESYRPIFRVYADDGQPHARSVPERESKQRAANYRTNHAEQNEAEAAA